MASFSKASQEFAPIIGAEARIELIDWHGRNAILKTRFRKAYRNEKLDLRLRSKRTREEADILHSAKLLGVDCPVLYYADPQRNELVMEYVEGKVLRDLGGSFPLKEPRGNSNGISELFFVLGKYIGKLHSGNLIHGDLTTKNVIITQENRLALIDFGLSFVSSRVEDKAEDLHLLKQALKSTENPVAAKDLFDVVIKGYSSKLGRRFTKQVISQMQAIEKRGRYARVD